MQNKVRLCDVTSLMCPFCVPFFPTEAFTLTFCSPGQWVLFPHPVLVHRAQRSPSQLLRLLLKIRIGMLIHLKVWMAKVSVEKQPAVLSRHELFEIGLPRPGAGNNGAALHNK